MPEVLPFAALRYDTRLAGPLDRLTAPPYDVVAPDAYARLLERSPYNVVRLEGAASGGDDREHVEAGELLRAWRRDGVLVDCPAALYAYEMTFDLGGRRRTVRGLLGALEVQPWGGDVIPHEATSARPVEERLGRLRAVRANLSPIHVILPGPSPKLGRSLSEAARSTPQAELLDAHGVVHRLWRLDETPFADEVRPQRCMIADGHHRYTTALAYRDEMRAIHGPGPWDHVLALVVDASEEPPVLPFHRVIRRGAMPAPDRETASLEATVAALDDEAGVVGLLRPTAGGGVRYGIVELHAPPPAVAALEPRIPADEDAVRFTPTPGDAEAAVRSGEATGAWLLPPTSAARLRELIDTGRRLPRKSTYFWPKPRTGLVLRPLD